MIALVAHRRTAQATGFGRMGEPLHSFTTDGGVGGNHPQPAMRLAIAAHAMAPEGGGDAIDLGIVQIRGNLDKERNLPAMLCCQSVAPPHEGIEQGVQRLVALQCAQVLGVGTADVDRHIVGPGIHPFESLQIIAGCLLDRGGGILADVQPQQAARMGRPARLHVADEGLKPIIVEPEAVDDGLCLGQAEQTWLGIAGLGAWRDRSHFHEAEAHGFPGADAARILVQSCRQTDPVGKSQPAQRHGIFDEGLGNQMFQGAMLQPYQRAKQGVMGGLRIHAKENRPGQGVGNECHEVVG